MSTVLSEQLDNINNSINKYILKKIIDIFKTEDNNISLLESNGSSVVILSSQHNYVFQYYKSEKVFKNICEIFKNLENSQISFKICNEISISFILEEYLSSYKGNLTNYNTILWEKIDPINILFKFEKIEHFISINIYKFLWDIGKALYGLHSKNYIHGDPTIDNIGIKNNKFILYDFDFSYKKSVFYTNKDYYKLLSSCKLYIEDKNLFKIICEIIDSEENMLIEVLHNVMTTLSITDIKDGISYLDNFKIIYS